MRIVVASIVFAITLGGIFLFSDSKVEKLNQRAQILEQLEEPVQTLPPSESATPQISHTSTPRTVIPNQAPSTSIPPPQDNILVLSSQPLIYKLKQKAELRISTLPQTQCSIKVTLPSGT